MFNLKSDKFGFVVVFNFSQNSIPPSDEGGGKTTGFDGGRDNTSFNYPSVALCSTAPLTSGATHFFNLNKN